MTRRASTVAALLASLALAMASAVVSSGPAVAGAGDFLLVESGQPVEGTEQSVGEPAVAEGDDPVTVDDLRSLVALFEATGEVTYAGARRMELALAFAENSINRGTPDLAIESLEVFKQVASDPRYVPSAAARDELVAAADKLIAQLSDTL